jgi:hypothetical protein
MGIGPRLCIMLDTNYLELRYGEVRRIPLKRTSENPFNAKFTAP